MQTAGDFTGHPSDVTGQPVSDLASGEFPHWV
jgi:hypothetical protein